MIVIHFGNNKVIHTYVTYNLSKIRRYEIVTSKVKKGLIIETDCTFAAIIVTLQYYFLSKLYFSRYNDILLYQ